MAEKSRSNKVLRIGVIQDGKIVRERVMKGGESVTVGESQKASVVFPKTHLPAEFVIFKWTGKEYVLRFTEQMKGKIDRIGAANAVVALQNLRDDPSVSRADGVFSYPLTEQDRGKLTIDQVTILFQFVAAPAPVNVSTQVTDFRPRLMQEDDPVFLGFLGLWGAMGIMLGLWVAFTEPPELTLDNAPQLARLIVPPKVDVPVVEPETEAVPTEAAAPKPAPTSGGPSEPAKGVARDAGSASARKGEIIAESKLLAGLIGTTGEGKSGMEVEDVLGSGSSGDVSAALAGAVGATTSSGEAGFKAGAGGRGGAATIGEIGGLGGGQGGVGTQGAAAATLKVSASAGEGSMEELTGDKATVAKTVRGYAGQVKYCYESRLKVVPGLGGRVEIGWSIDAGAVSGVYTVSNDTGDAELAKCIEGKIRRWKFPADSDGDVSWPFLLSAKGG